MQGPAREAYQQETSPSAASSVNDSEFGSGIRYGTVGWENVPSRVVLGATGTPDQGITLVRVTLFEGRQIGPKPQTGIAQGHQVVAHILGPSFDVPPLGTRVVVAFPEGDFGPGLILGTVGPSPTQQFSDTRTVVARQNLTLGDPSGNGTVEISPTGITLGHGATDAPALASVVDANFKAITDYLTANMPATSGGNASWTSVSGGAVSSVPVPPTASTIPSMSATGSSFVKSR